MSVQVGLVALIAILGGGFGVFGAAKSNVVYCGVGVALIAVAILLLVGLR